MNLQDYGAYVYFLAWVTILGQVSLLGFDTSIIRFAASYAGTRKFEDLRGLLVFGSVLPLAVGLLASAVLLLVAGMEALWAALLIPVFVLNNVRQAALRGFKHVVQATFPDQVLRPLLIMILAWATFSSAGRLSTAEALKVHVIAALIVLAVGLCLLIRGAPGGIRGCGNRVHARFWLQTSLPLLWMSVLILVVNQTDLVMLGLLATPEATARFSVAARVSEIALFGFVAINSIAAPLFAEHHAANNRVKLLEITGFSAFSGFAYMLVLCLLLVVCGKMLLGLFGAAYVNAYPALLILLVGQFVNSCTGSVGNLLSMTGHQNVVAVAMTGVALTNLLLNLLLIPLYGIEGAAAATAFSVSALNIVLYLAVKRQLGFDPGIAGYVRRKLFCKA